MTKLRQKLQISHFDVIRALHYLTNKHGGEKSTGTQKTISQNLFNKILWYLAEFLLLSYFE